MLFSNINQNVIKVHNSMDESHRNHVEQKTLYIQNSIYIQLQNREKLMIEIRSMFTWHGKRLSEQVHEETLRGHRNILSGSASYIEAYICQNSLNQSLSICACYANYVS